MDNKILMNEKQAAELLGVAVKTMQQWRHFGRGPKFVKVGRLCRYRPADIDAYITGRTVHPGA